MRKIIIAAAASAMLLTGCGEAMQSLSANDAFSITLSDGRTVECVQVTGHSGSVAVTCDFDSARLP